MTASMARQRRLVDIAYDMVVEFESLPAGTVLRSFFRAAHRARVSGVEPSALPEVARQSTRTALASRQSSRVPMCR
jgi:hypothetical protein